MQGQIILKDSTSVLLFRLGHVSTMSHTLLRSFIKIFPIVNELWSKDEIQECATIEKIVEQKNIQAISGGHDVYVIYAGNIN